MLIQPRGHHTPFGLPFSGGSVVLFESFALESDSLGLNPNSIMYLLCDRRQITLPHCALVSSAVKIGIIVYLWLF